MVLPLIMAVCKEEGCENLTSPVHKHYYRCYSCHIKNKTNPAIEEREKEIPVANNNSDHSKYWSKFPEKKRICRICKSSSYDTQWHHIISRGKAKKMRRIDLISNFGNVVELCIPCHDLTPASGSWRYHKKRKYNECQICSEPGHYAYECPKNHKPKFKNLLRPQRFFELRNFLFNRCKRCGRSKHHNGKCTMYTYFDEKTPIYIHPDEIVSMPKDNAQILRMTSISFFLLLMYIGAKEGDLTWLFR